ncbi:PEP-CTERM sorting domain-containing protein [Planctomycetales bacterium ZRK34]|nr:PEP-CTERM sorting domain-containing protein [Planctomycetales bacterium ZRK34]
MINRFFIGVVVVAAMALGPVDAAKAVFLSGTEARATFDDLVANYGATLIDFESFTSGTNLTTQVPGVSFESVYFFNVLNPPEHVEASGAYNASAFGRTIVGSYYPTASDDGRVVYQIVFDTPQRAAGIHRIWNNTLTTFYTASDVAIYTGEDSGYHGVLIESNDPADWVKRIYCDAVEVSGTRQVGYSDDLIFGDTIPEPAAICMLALGVALLGRRRYI